jgi:DNA polymerase III epsilon subunit-like protein
VPCLPLSSETPLRGAPVAVLDFETTGIEPGHRHPVQVAICPLSLGDEPGETWQSLIRPPVPIPPEAAAIHGITDERVADAPTWAEVEPEVLRRLDGRVLCAYNLPFDWAVLCEAMADGPRAAEAPPFGGLDPLVWAKLTDKYEKGKRLEDVAGRRGIHFAAHDAAADVGATARLLGLLLRQLALDRHLRRPALDRLDHFWRWQLWAALVQEREYRDWRLRKGDGEPQLSWHPAAGTALSAALERPTERPTAAPGR